MDKMTKESAADIIKYLDIIDDPLPAKLKEGDSIHLGVAIQGVEVGQQYLFDNGIRWMTIISETDSSWFIEYGLIEHSAEDNQHILKREISSKIHSGELVLNETDYDDILAESSTVDDGEYNNFMLCVDRYLLINHMIESQDLDYAWKIAWAEGIEPSEACEEAILLEG